MKPDKVFFDLTMTQFISFMFTFFAIYFTVQTSLPGLLKWVIVIVEVIIGGAVTWGEVEGITFTEYAIIMLIYVTSPRKFVYSNEYKHKLFSKILSGKIK